MKKALTVFVCFLLMSEAVVLSGEESSKEISIQSLPPSVVKTVPECGSTDVDAMATTQIKATFSKDMMDGHWAWVQISDETFPKTIGKPKYLDDKRTCVLNVLLESNKTYVIWLNSGKFQGFMDTEGNKAVPYLLVFKTK
jgi:hypothetical protein